MNVIKAFTIQTGFWQCHHRLLEGVATDYGESVIECDRGGFYESRLLVMGSGFIYVSHELFGDSIAQKITDAKLDKSGNRG